MIPFLAIKNFGRQYIRRSFGKKVPYFAGWYITSQCNLKCKGCLYYERLINKNPTISDGLSLETGYLLIKKMREIGISILVFIGGEPLIKEELFLWARRAKEMGIATLLSTNGILVNEENIEEIKRYFNFFQLSIDGPEEINDRIRGKGSYKKAVHSLELLKNSKRPYILISTNVSKDNIDHLHTFILNMSKYRIDRLKFHANVFPEYSPTPEQTEKFIKMAIHMKLRHPILMAGSIKYFKNFKLYFDRSIPKVCPGQSLVNIGIDVNGDVYICCGNNIRIGSILKDDWYKIVRVSEEINYKSIECYGCHTYTFRTKYTSRNFYNILKFKGYL